MTLTEGEKRIWTSVFAKNFHNKDKPKASTENDTGYDKWLKQYVEDVAIQSTNTLLHLRDLKERVSKSPRNDALAGVLEQVLG